MLNMACESSVLGWQRAVKEKFMKKSKKTSEHDTMRTEYKPSDLRNGVRGKYLKQYRQGTNLALLDPVIRAAFPIDQAVNDALKSLMAKGLSGK
jgi:hypothetical protein